MKAVLLRLVVLGGLAAGVELAQVVCRLGGEVVLVEGAERVLSREPTPLGVALSEALRRDEIVVVLRYPRDGGISRWRGVRLATGGWTGAAR